MANTHHSITGQRPWRAGAAGGLPWATQLQLDAYLEAREALRRARAAALTAPWDRPPNSRPTEPQLRLRF